MFGKKKGKNVRTIQKEQKIQGDIVEDTTIFEKAPWYIRLIFNLKKTITDLDPMRLALWVILIVWIIAITILILLPFMGAIEEVPNRMPFTGGITTAFIVWWLSYVYHRHFEGRKCVLALDGRRIFVDNSKVDVLPKSERVYVVNAYGNPIFNIDEGDPRRYMQQKTISVPKEIIEQFGSVRGMSALSYSDCSLTEVSMEEVDFSIFYMPRHISEERLIRENDRLKLAIALGNDIITKLKRDMIAAVKNLRGSEKERLEGLIEQMSSLKQAFYGSPEQLREMVRQEMYQPRQWGGRFGGYQPYQSEYTQPSWSKFSSGRQDEEEQDDSG
jgi:hypothetical protein